MELAIHKVVSDYQFLIFFPQQLIIDQFADIRPRLTVHVVIEQDEMRLKVCLAGKVVLLFEIAGEIFDIVGSVDVEKVNIDDLHYHHCWAVL